MLEILTKITWSLFCFVLCFIIIEYHVSSDKTIYRKWLYPLLLIKILFGFFATLNKGDYIRYVYEIRAFSNPEFGFSTPFVVYFFHFLRIFNFEKSYFFYFFPSMIFSYVGIIYLYKSITFVYPKLANSWWLFLILFLPGLSYWTAPLGKDGMFLFGNTFFIYHMLKKGNFIGFKQLLGLSFVFIIRPHILILIIISFFISKILSSESKSYIRITYLLIGVVAFVLSIPLINSALQVDIMDFKAIGEQIILSSTYAQDGTSYVNMTSYPLVYKVFTYLFRPLPYEFVSVAFIPFSFENVLLLFLVFPLFRLSSWKIAIKNQSTLFFLLTSIFIPLLLSNAMGNFGLFLRQKWMIFPYLFIFVSMVKKYRSQSLN